MEWMELLQKRRSVREYTGEPIPETQLEQILKAGLLAPSSRSRRPWELILVEDKDTLNKMALCRDHGAKMLEHAGAAVVVLTDPEKSDVTVEDASIVMTHMHLTAEILGLGSCWIQSRLRTAADGRSTTEFLRELLGFPEQMQVEAILSVGVPLRHPAPYTEDDLPVEKLHRERY